MFYILVAFFEVLLYGLYGTKVLQVGYKVVPDKNIKKPEKGHCDKAGTPPLRHLVEFKVKSASQLEGMDVGSVVDMATLFQPDQFVDVAGMSIGKGFQGTVKRWGHHRGPMTHGASARHVVLKSVWCRFDFSCALAATDLVTDKVLLIGTNPLTPWGLLLPFLSCQRCTRMSQLQSCATADRLPNNKTIAITMPLRTLQVPSLTGSMVPSATVQPHPACSPTFNTLATWDMSA
jgi:hypothetical protein